MIFPEDTEIRGFTSYAIRARKIIIEEFSKLEGRHRVNWRYKSFSQWLLFHSVY